MDGMREALEDYVASGKLMQIATVSSSGHPAVCSAWYQVQFRPDRLHFISRYDRQHSANIRKDERVAGAIVAIPVSGLGQTVRGVTFKGSAYELDVGARAEIEGFLERWPRAASALAPDDATDPEMRSRLYEICVSEWVLFDEERFPESPRCVIPGIS